MDLGISGRRAAVAAASDGLGFASANALAAEGADVAICGRDRVRVDEAAARIGHGCVPLVCDVSSAAGGAAFVAAAAEALGGVDIIVANAGGPPPGTFREHRCGSLRAGARSQPAQRGGDVYCGGAGHAARMGRVVAITSVAVRQPIPTLILSNTARAGVTGFLKTVAREVAPDGVTVNSVQPGYHDTARMSGLFGGDPDFAALGVPAGVLGVPADLGAVVAFLCGDQAKFVTGVQLHVDGGSYAGLQ